MRIRTCFKRWNAAAAAILLVAALCFAAGPALSLTLDIYADGTTGIGFDATDAGDLLAGGIPQIPGNTMFGNPSAGPELFRVLVGDTVTDPMLDGTSQADPSSGSTEWTLRTDPSGADYSNLWLVIQGHSPDDDFYDTANVGLGIDMADPNWALIHPLDAQGDELTQFWYLAYFIGDLFAAGDSASVPIDYRVSQKIFRETSMSGGTMTTEYTFPKYHSVLMEQVPEPATVGMLLVAGLVGLTVRRRATC